uniref:CCHC-type domain-containing protein n=1 Tax=Musca domestica TaxID=7370 RepID=A0A1I8NJ03_MUSDO
MSRETRSKSKSRKRDRPILFDLNRTINILEEKRQKTQNLEKMAEENQRGEGQIMDFSQTINSRAPMSNPLGPSYLQGAGEGSETQRTVHNPEQIKVLETSIKRVQSEMGDIRKTLGDLTSAMDQLLRKQGGNVSNTPQRESNGMLNHGGITALPSTDTRPERQPDETRPKEVSIAPTSSSSNNGGTNGSHTRPVTMGTGKDFSIVRLNKLGLTFDGGSNSLGVEEFVYRLEYYQKQYNIPWSEVIRDFPLILSGRAESWYWLLQKTHGIHSWDHLKYSILSQYQSSKSNFEILTELAQRKQQINESVDNFFHAMGQVRAKLVQPISEFDMMKILKKNVKDSIGRIVYPIQVSSVEQLRVECNEAERNFLRRENRPTLPMARQLKHVNEISEDVDVRFSDEQEEGELKELAAMQYNRQVKPQLTCWNCRKLGHSFRDCEEATRALFCYKCGNPGTTTPRCKMCQQGNGNKGGDQEGRPRPN